MQAPRSLLLIKGTIIHSLSLKEIELLQSATLCVDKATGSILFLEKSP